MPRKARIDAPGALHHIIVRGIDRTAIFRDETDYENFLLRLGHLLTESSTPCLAWALMGNHLHLLLRTGRLPISTLMHRLLTGYAQQFNRRHRRHGVLFQNRYKSILCEEEVYLLALVRYIHLNPLRAGIVKNIEALRSFPRCGHSALMGRVARDWQEAEYILRRFDVRLRQARRAYEQFVAGGVSQGRRPELVGGGLIRSAGGWAAIKALRGGNMRVMGDERILGGGDFVQAVLEQARERYEKKTLAAAKGFSLDALIEGVAQKLGLAAADLQSAVKQRNSVRGRSSLCALAIEYLGISGRELSRRLNVSPSAVSKLAQRGRKDTQTETLAKAFFQAPG
ncbi:MAG: transposase [Desulfobacterales bacterium]|jgi:REP element-mobilizing transposase RayT|nr:transposase [Desulfobacterales bacterium]